jgi:hypothetical protein
MRNLFVSKVSRKASIHGWTINGVVSGIVEQSFQYIFVESVGKENIDVQGKSCTTSNRR